MVWAKGQQLITPSDFVFAWEDAEEAQYRLGEVGVKVWKDM